MTVPIDAGSSAEACCSASSFFCRRCRAASDNGGTVYTRPPPKSYSMPGMSSGIPRLLREHQLADHVGDRVREGGDVQVVHRVVVLLRVEGELLRCALAEAEVRLLAVEAARQVHAEDRD